MLMIVGTSSVASRVISMIGHISFYVVVCVVSLWCAWCSCSFNERPNNAIVSAFVLPSSSRNNHLSSPINPLHNPFLIDQRNIDIDGIPFDGSGASFSSYALSSSLSSSSLYSIRFLKGQVTYGDPFSGSTASSTGAAAAYLPNGGDPSTTLLRHVPDARRRGHRRRSNGTSGRSLWYRNAINPAAPRTRLAFGSMEIFPVTTEHVQVLIEKSEDGAESSNTELSSYYSYNTNNVVDQRLVDRSVQAVMEQWQQRRRRQQPTTTTTNSKDKYSNDQAFPSYQPSQILEEQCTQTVRVSVQDGELYPFIGTISTPVLDAGTKQNQDEDSLLMVVHNAPSTANTPMLNTNNHMDRQLLWLQPGAQGGPLQKTTASLSSNTVLEAAVLPLLGTTTTTTPILMGDTSQQSQRMSNVVQKKTVSGKGSTQTFSVNTTRQNQNSWLSKRRSKEQIQVVLETVNNNGQHRTHPPWEARIEVWHGIISEKEGPMTFLNNLPLPIPGMEHNNKKQNKNNNKNNNNQDCRIALDVSSKHPTFSTIMDLMPPSVLEQYYGNSDTTISLGLMQPQHDEGYNNNKNNNNNRYQPPKTLEQYLQIRIINTGTTALQASVIQQSSTAAAPIRDDRVVRPNSSLLQQQSRIRSMETPMTMSGSSSWTSKTPTLSSNPIRTELDKARPQLQPNPFLANDDEANRRSPPLTNSSNGQVWTQRNLKNKNSQTRYVVGSSNTNGGEGGEGKYSPLYNRQGSKSWNGNSSPQQPQQQQQQRSTGGVVPGKEHTSRPQLHANPFLSDNNDASQASFHWNQRIRSVDGSSSSKTTRTMQPTAGQSQNGISPSNMAWSQQRFNGNSESKDRSPKTLGKLNTQPSDNNRLRLTPNPFLSSDENSYESLSAKGGGWTKRQIGAQRPSLQPSKNRSNQPVNPGQRNNKNTQSIFSNLFSSGNKKSNQQSSTTYTQQQSTEQQNLSIQPTTTGSNRPPTSNGQRANSFPRPSSAFGRSSIAQSTSVPQKANTSPKLLDAFGRSNNMPSNSSPNASSFPRPSSALGRSNQDQYKQRDLEERRGVPVRADTGLLDEKASRIQYGMTTEEERYRYDPNTASSHGVDSKWDLTYWMNKDTTTSNKQSSYHHRSERQDDSKQKSSNPVTPWINRDYTGGTNNLNLKKNGYPSTNEYTDDSLISRSNSFSRAFDSSMEDFRNQGGTRSYTDSVSKSFQRVQMREGEIMNYGQKASSNSIGNNNFLNSYIGPTHRNGQKSPSDYNKSKNNYSGQNGQPYPSIRERNNNNKNDSNGDTGGFLGVAKQLLNGLRWDDDNA